MIRIFNPNRLTAHPFFQELIAYIDEHDEVILRQIKQHFSEQKTVDKLMEQYIKAGYITRQNKRYSLSLSFLKDLDSLELDDMVFIRSDRSIYKELLDKRFLTFLENETNQVVIVEETSFSRDELTLANYFYKLKHQYPISSAQKGLYAILGDVNPEYALKYMTAFLLKCVKKDVVVQKRADIFVDSLVELGYIQKIEEHTYSLRMTFQSEQLLFRKK